MPISDASAPAGSIRLSSSFKNLALREQWCMKFGGVMSRSTFGSIGSFFVAVSERTLLRSDHLGYISDIEKTTNIKRALSSCVLFAALVLSSGSIAAQSGSYGLHEKAIERINLAQKVAPVSVDGAFGDSLSLFNGTVQFENIDISIPGNSEIPVELRRVYEIRDRREFSVPLGNAGHRGGFGEWDLDVPYLKGVFSATTGWKVGQQNSVMRCSSQNAPAGLSGFASYEYWDGYHLHVPGKVSGLMLANPNASLPVPSDGASYPWITKDMWRVGCKSSTQNGYGGEGFIAISPEGFRYHLDWAITVPMSSISSRWVSNPATGSGMNSLQRAAVYFVASRVEDRFGNWVNYNWSGNRLLSIAASDGRQITLSYAGDNVSVASAGSQTRSYSYLSGRLSSVNLPDGSAWRYQSAGSLRINSVSMPEDDYIADCPEYFESSSGYFNYEIENPSGAKSLFNFTVRRHYRHNVPFTCMKPRNDYEYLQIPNYSDVFSLDKKSVSGPGIPLMEWNYSYGNGFQEIFQNACNPIGSGMCSQTKKHVVTGPGGTWDRYEYGILYGVNEGQLITTETGSGSNSVLRVVSNSYVTTAEVSSYPFPSQVGTTLVSYSDPVAVRLRPLKSTSILQDGVQFTRRTDSFDVFARPTSVTRSSQPSP